MTIHPLVAWTGLFFVIFPVSPIVAQEHPYSNAWSYIATVFTEDLNFSATTVAGTGGTDTHTMQAVVISLRSPLSRSAWAGEYPSGTTAQATAYLPICTETMCEDGKYFASNQGTAENCGVTYQTLALAETEAEGDLPAFMVNQEVSFFPVEIERKSGVSRFRITVTKSQNCSSGTALVQLAHWLHRGTPSYSVDPNTSSMNLAFGSGHQAHGDWSFTSSHLNNHDGEVHAAGTLNAPQSCPEKGPPNRGASLMIK
jgi:hypothetical protein